MKIHKQLKIDSQPARLIKDNIKLELFTPGRALFSCEGVTPAPGHLVEINGQFSGNENRRLFFGFIETVVEIQTGVFQCLAREMSATLNRRIALNLRHCTPAQVLESISDKTGLQFVLPEQPWTETTIARFQHIGGGYMALDSILKLWNIKKGTWHQQPDGKVFVGELAHSVPGQRRINIQPGLFQLHSLTGGTLPLVPRLRPGVEIDIAGRVWVITSVEITAEQMRLQWSENPWNKHLKAIQ